MLDAIPLQAILQFNPPPRELAIAHLGSVCEQLGLERDTDYLAGLHDRSMVDPPRILQNPGPPNGNEWLPYFDLRRAIMQLQLERGVSLNEAPPSEREAGDLEMLLKRAEVVSYTDAYLAERSWATMEVSRSIAWYESKLIWQLSEIDRYVPTPDDQLGIKTLLKPELPDHIPILPAYDRTTEISSCLLLCQGGTRLPDDLLYDQ